MRFGINVPKKLTGADIYVRLLQILSLLPVFYIFAISGYSRIITTHNVLSMLFDGSFAALPRAEALGLSLLYRATASEIAVNFLLLGLALAFGLAMNKLLRGKTAKTVRIVLLVCVGADLVLRLLPFAFNRHYGTALTVIAFALRLICLALLLGDLIADKKSRKTVDRQA